MSEIKNKIIWITGASSGIGEALTYELVNRGAKVIISARRTQELERVKQQCALESQSNIYILPLDLSKPEELKRIVEQANDLFGSIDILINNGGISQRGLAQDTLFSVDRKIMEIDYFGTIALTKYLLPYFIKQKSGHYVTVTSVVGKVGTPYRTSYSAAKHALHGFFDALRAEIYKYNIYVTLILPGWVSTNISLNALSEDGSLYNKMDSKTQDGLKAKDVAVTICNSIVKNKNEIKITGFKEGLAIYLKLFVPYLFSLLLRKVVVK